MNLIVVPLRLGILLLLYAATGTNADFVQDGDTPEPASGCQFPEALERPFFYTIRSSAQAGHVVLRTRVVPDDARPRIVSVRSNTLPRVNLTEWLELRRLDGDQFELVVAAPNLALPRYPSRIRSALLYVTVACGGRAFPLMTLHLVDDLQTPPLFYNTPYRIAISKATAVGTTVETPLLAVDWDPASSYQVSLDLVSGNGHNFFRLASPDSAVWAVTALPPAFKAVEWRASQLPSMVRLIVARELTSVDAPNAFYLNFSATDSTGLRNYAILEIVTFVEHAKPVVDATAMLAFKGSNSNNNNDNNDSRDGNPRRSLAPEELLISSDPEKHRSPPSFDRQLYRFIVPRQMRNNTLVARIRANWRAEEQDRPPLKYRLLAAPSSLLVRTRNNTAHLLFQSGGPLLPETLDMQLVAADERNPNRRARTTVRLFVEDEEILRRLARQRSSGMLLGGGGGVERRRTTLIIPPPATSELAAPLEPENEVAAGDNGEAPDEIELVGTPPNPAATLEHTVQSGHPRSASDQTTSTLVEEDDEREEGTRVASVYSSQSTEQSIELSSSSGPGVELLPTFSPSPFGPNESPPSSLAFTDISSPVDASTELGRSAASPTSIVAVDASSSSSPSSQLRLLPVRAALLLLVRLPIILLDPTLEE